MPKPRFKTTFDLESAELHHDFKVECLQNRSNMTTELNKFIKRYVAGEESVNEQLKTICNRLIKHAKAADLDVSEYETYLKEVLNNE